METTKSQWYEEPIFNLFVKPTYSVLLPQRTARRNPLSQSQIKALVNLKDNKVKGELSKTSATKLKNAINWLTAAAPMKTIYHKSSGQKFKFKLNFITLTLPTTEHEISDDYFKKKILHNFLNTARYKFGLKNYVWKVEAQKNGNIHAHLTTDTFIHYADLSKAWNKILSTHGLIEAYTTKHKAMSFDDYNVTYNKGNARLISQVRDAYEKGVSSGWTQPNSTDVKAVHKIDDIAAYLIKYMAKSEAGKRPIKGRLWGCSYNLSQANNLTVEVRPDNAQQIMKPLMQKAINFKPIEIKDKLSGLPRKIGECFLYTLKDWGSLIVGQLNDIYSEHLFFIRNNINTEALRFYNYESIIQPEPIEVYDSFAIPGKPIECPF